MKKPANLLLPISPEEPNAFELPEVSPATVRLMESRPPPSFAEQIAHARMLLAWRKGKPADHPPRQNDRFEM